MPEKHEPGPVREAPEGGGEPPTEAWTPPAEEQTAPNDEGADGVQPEAQARSGIQAEAQAQAASDPFNSRTAGLTDFYTYEEFPHFGDALDMRVNVGNGNLYLSSDVISLNGPGVQPSMTTFYNSRSFLYSTMGILDYANAGLQLNGDTILYHDRTGKVWEFTKSGTSWVSPPGLNATLSRYFDSAWKIDYHGTGEFLAFTDEGWLSWFGNERTANETNTGVEGTRVQPHYNGRLITSLEAGGSTGLFIEFTYSTISGKEVLTQIKDSSNRVADLTYVTLDGSPFLQKFTLPGAGTVTLGYDELKRLNSINHGGRTAAVTYSGFGGAVTKIVFTKGNETSTTSFAYNNASNITQTTVTDPRGGTTKYQIDGSQRVTSVTDQLNRRREQTWTSNSAIATTTNGLTSGSTGFKTTYSFDGLNNPTRMQLPTGAATQAFYAAGPNCQGAQTGNIYLPKCTIDASGNRSSMSYDSWGRLTNRTNTSAGGAQESFNYTYTGCSSRGQVCTATDGKGNVTSYTYNTKGLVTKVTPPTPAKPTTYTYDNLARISTVTDGAGQTTTYWYDDRDRVVIEEYSNGDFLWNEHNTDGSLQIRNHGTSTGVKVSIGYQYNLLGFQTQQTTTSQADGSLPQAATMTYDANGNLTRVHGTGVGAGEASFTYDAANQRLTTQLQGGNCAAANSPGCIRYQYNHDGAETARIFPFGARQDTTRDNSGRPTRITVKDKNGAVQNDIAYSYALAGADTGSLQTRTSHKEQGVTAGAITTYGYDTRSRLTSAVEKTGTTTSASWTYQYDKADNRTRQVRTGSTGAPAGTIDYTYDAANRLTGATGSNGAWTYNDTGDQTRNALTGVSSTYGPRQNVTANGTTTYETFGRGNDLQLKVGGTAQKYTTLGVSSPATDRIITRDNTGTAVATRVGTVTGYITADHLGSTTGLIGVDGLYLGGYSYSPYGETRSTSTNATVAGNTIRHIGGHLEPGTGLYKLGARYYDASLGRFTQMDPTGQESNPYAYASCDPVNNLDPAGTSCFSAWATWTGTLALFGITAIGTIITSPTGAGLALGIAALSAEALILAGAGADYIDQCNIGA